MTQPKTPALNLRRILGSPTYRRAYEDVALLHLPELRAVRLQLELVKPELLLDKERIESTLVLFGGSRIPPPDVAAERVAVAERRLKESPADDEAKRQLAVARSLQGKAKYYVEARRLAQIASEECQQDGDRRYVVCTGGGPGIMEAGNRGAYDVDKCSIGLNITLPHEQAPNAYVTPELCFLFHYFAVRKMHFLLRAKAAVYFPGGFGTLDELFETLTLIQTDKMKPIPLVLIGVEFWTRLVDWDFLVAEGTISPRDVDLFHICDTAAEAWDWIKGFDVDPDLPTGGDTSEMIG